jgi:hypothetical protein
VQAWDKESGTSNVTNGMFVSEHGMQGLCADMAGPSESHKEIRGAKDSPEVVEVEMEKGAVKMTRARSMSSTQPLRFNVPLTSMFCCASMLMTISNELRCTDRCIDLMDGADDGGDDGGDCSATRGMVLR